MDLVCRVLYEAQQDYCACVAPLSNGDNPDVPSFNSILTKVLTHRAASLSPLPSPWHLMAGAPKVLGSRREAPEASPRRQAGAVATLITHPDTLLMSRFRDSAFSKISEMAAGHEGSIPKHAGKEVCLAWALKGACSASCRRKEQHVRYPAGVMTKLNSTRFSPPVAWRTPRSECPLRVLLRSRPPWS